MQENQMNYQEDEIDLRELWQTVLNGKVIIAVVTTLITILAVAYAYTKTPIYEVKSHVQIGFIGEKLIVNPNTAVKTLKIMFDVEDKKRTEEEFVSEVSSIEVNKKIPNFITIKTQGISNDEAVKKNQEVTQSVIAEYKPTIDKYILDTNNNIQEVLRNISKVKTIEMKDIEKKIDILKNQRLVQLDEKIKYAKVDTTNSINNKIAFHTKNLKTYNSAMEKLYKQTKDSKDKTGIMISSIQMVNYQNLILNSQNSIENLKLELIKIDNETIPDLNRAKERILNDDIRKLQNKIDLTLKDKIINLEEKKQSLEYNLLSQNVQNSKVVGDYIVNDYPTKPKKKLIVVVAFVTGLILSIFLVFFLNFIRSEEKKEVL